MKFSSYHMHRTRQGADRLSIIDWKGSMAGKSVLDLGCGSGLLSVEAARAGAANVMGFDKNSEYIAMAKGQAIGMENVGFETRNIESPRFQFGLPMFDVVLFCAVLKWMMDRPKMMRFVDRITKQTLWFETNRVRPDFDKEAHLDLLREHTNFKRIEEIAPGYERGYFMFRCEK